MCSIPGLGRSPGEGNGNALQYPCLEHPMDGGAWQATTVHGVTNSWTWLSNFTLTFRQRDYFSKSCFCRLVKEEVVWTVKGKQELKRDFMDIKYFLFFCKVIILCHPTQYASKFGKLSSGNRTGKGQFSFQSKERQCQRMFKQLHNHTHLTCLVK